MVQKGVVIVSGGMDSVTLLYDLHARGYDLHALTFDYGQKHVKEIECAKKNCKALGIPHTIIDMKFFSDIAKSALTTKGEEVPEGNYDDENMKQTVVPNRNMVMLSIAAAFALSHKLDYLFYGAHSGDHCLVADELVITDQGKAQVQYLEIGDRVLSADPKTGIASMEKITNILCNGFREDIFQISTKGGRQIRLTSNHKVFRINRSNFHQHTGWQKNIEEVPVSELQVDDWVLTPVTERNFLLEENSREIDLLEYCDVGHPQLKYNDTHVWFKSDNMLPRFIKSEVFVKLIAWFIAEGSFPGPSQSNTYRMSISQKKETEEYDEIVKLLDLWGFSYTYHEQNMSFYFSGPTTYVFRLCGRISSEKQIPDDMLFMHPKVMLDTLIMGDGHDKGDGKYVYTTKSWLLKEQISYLCSMMGYSCGINQNSQGIFTMSIGMKLNKDMNKYGNCKMVQIKTIEKSTPGIVYDITVENTHTFFAGEGSGILVSNSIYPDCRPPFIQAMKNVFNLCDWKRVRLEVPYIKLDKAGILKVGLPLGVPYGDTWTCYKGGKEACGVCGSCTERLEAFKMVNLEDPLPYAKG